MDSVIAVLKEYLPPPLFIAVIFTIVGWIGGAFINKNFIQFILDIFQGKKARLEEEIKQQAEQISIKQKEVDSLKAELKEKNRLHLFLGAYWDKVANCYCPACRTPTGALEENNDQGTAYCYSCMAPIKFPSNCGGPSNVIAIVKKELAKQQG